MKRSEQIKISEAVPAAQQLDELLDRIHLIGLAVAGLSEFDGTPKASILRAVSDAEGAVLCLLDHRGSVLVRAE